MAEIWHRGAVSSLRRIRLVAGHTMREALRMKVALLLVLTASGLVLAARALRAYNFGNAELKFIGDFGLGAIGLFGTLLAALATAQLFFGSMAEGTMDCVLTRTVRRWEYVGGQFAGVAGLLALFTAIVGGLLAAVLAWRGAQLGMVAATLPTFLCACAVLWLKLTLVAAMTLAACSYAGSALFASCAGLMLAAVAQLRSLAPAGGELAWLRVWPNLALFDAEAVFAAGQPPSGAALLGGAAYWAAYILVFNALASFIFARREF